VVSFNVRLILNTRTQDEAFENYVDPCPRHGVGDQCIRVAIGDVERNIPFVDPEQRRDDDNADRRGTKWCGVPSGNSWSSCRWFGCRCYWGAFDAVFGVGGWRSVQGTSVRLNFVVGIDVMVCYKECI
jgi:hypothetical protein